MSAPKVCRFCLESLADCVCDDGEGAEDLPGVPDLLGESGPNTVSPRDFDGVAPADPPSAGWADKRMDRPAGRPAATRGD